MKRWIALIAVLTISCAASSTRKIPIVRFGQMSKVYCAKETLDGKPFARVILFVVQPFGENEPVTITVTNGEKARLVGPSIEIPSGVGAHEVTVEVGEHRFVRTYFVFECKGKIELYRTPD